MILSLGDKVLREASKMTTALSLWNRLETLYLTKTLSTRLFLKTRFFSFRMGEGQKLHDHIDDFTKLCLDLENIDSKYDDEDKAVILLHSLPKTYETFVDILKHGRENLSLDDVIGALNSKELQQKVEVNSSPGDALAAGSRPEKGDQRNRGRGRSKSKNSRRSVRCFLCHEEGHIKKNCPNKKKESQEKTSPECSSTMCGFGYESADVL